MKTLRLETTAPFQGLPELVAYDEGLFEKEGLRVEWIDPHTKMIEIPGLGTGSRASKLAYRAIYRNEINQRIPGTNLIEADVFLDLFQRTSKNLDVEIQHRLEIHHAKDEMVDVFYLKHHWAAL